MIEKWWRGLTLLLTLAGFAVVLCWAFVWSPFGHSLRGNEYLFLVLASFLPIVFITRRWRASASAEGEESEAATNRSFAVPWYDAVLALAALAINVHLALESGTITEEGWDYNAPTLALVLAFTLWALVLEALRRTAGLIVTVIAGLFSIYPMFASRMPLDFLLGIEFNAQDTALKHVYGPDSIFGLPLQAGATVLVGFIFFGVALQRTGGADFFVDLARSIFGSTRGGTAKVAVTSSAAMGMMSGSAVSNVLTTGPMTIPAMKRSGYPAVYAGGIEATAASGGSITPPIMGTAAFIMVSFVGVPYTEIIVAAAIPALLFYLGIFVQVDGYAARARMRGEPRSQLPRVFATAAQGWPYLLALFALIFLLVVQRQEAQAPFITVAVLLAVTAVRKTHRLTLAGIRNLLIESGRSIADIIGIVAGVGLIVGGLSISGVSLSLSRELVSVAGDNLYVILIAGAVTSLILGMGMTISAVYVFLAIVMVPALVQLGVNEMAAHLFVIYWAAASAITPPVALAAFAAASISRTPPMRTGFMAMRLGMAKYVVPFAFALNPHLVAQGSLGDVMGALALAIVGISLLACGLEGWMPVVDRRMVVVERAIAVLAGVAMLGPDHVVAAVGAAVGMALAVWLRMARSEPDQDPVDESVALTASGERETQREPAGGGEGALRA